MKSIMWANRLNTQDWRERLALAVVLAIVAGLPAVVLGYQFGVRPWLVGAVQEVEIIGRLPQDGGWSQEVVRVEVGRPVRLRLTSADVVHGFAIGKLGVDAGWVYPGQPKIVEFTPTRAGRYTFYCTTWCAEGHWRMRGVLEVVDPADPAAVDAPIDPPLADWQAAGIDLDAPHLAEVFPSAPPSAARGARIWASAQGLPSVQEVLGRLDLRMQSPEEVYRWLAVGDAPDLAPLRALSSAERWDVVAYLWRANTSAANLELGRRLYLTNCAACHGERGDGRGPAAGLASPHEIHGMAETHGPRAPADFTDRRAAAGASDLVYYGKLVRGGMGTGMPYWGSIFTDEELWALVNYVRSFALGGEGSSSPPSPEGPP